MSKPVDTSDPPLSEEQLAAVICDDRAIAVVASAGSGKTEVVARRAQRLLERTADGGHRILALSYTKKAADELRSRLDQRLGALARNVETDTVHGFSYGLVRQQGTKIGLPLEPELLVRDEDRAELFTRWLQSQGKAVPADLEVELRELDLLRARNRNSPMLEEWQHALENASALDYPALVSAARMLLESKSTRRQLSRIYAHVIVDEAQNLTPSQYDLLTALVGAPDDFNLMSVMLVGDDKQSIVSFAGADPRLIQRFVKEYRATVFELTTNYRSANALSALANRISRAFGRGAVLDVDPTHGAPGSIIYREAPDEAHEAAVVADWIEDLLENGISTEALAAAESTSLTASEVAVLGRSAASLRYVGRTLEAKTIPFMAASGSSDWLDTTTAKIALEIVGLRADSGHQSVHWQLARLLDVDSSRVTSIDDLRNVLSESENPVWEELSKLCGVGTVGEFVNAVVNLEMPGSAETSQLAAWLTDVEQLRDSWTEFQRTTDQSSLTWGNFKLFCSRKQRGDDLVPGVRLLTIHKAQGREFRAVAVVGLNDGQLPDFRARTEDEQLAELRTFYVAVTRAKRVLLLTRATSRLTAYGSRRSRPSPYLQFVRSERQLNDE
jgi:DNA helicase II / ATP-dependent DNA helicase PcrA